MNLRKGSAYQPRYFGALAADAPASCRSCRMLCSCRRTFAVSSGIVVASATAAAVAEARTFVMMSCRPGSASLDRGDSSAPVRLIGYPTMDNTGAGTASRVP